MKYKLAETRTILPTMILAIIMVSILGITLFDGINNASAASSITLNVSPTITLDVTPSNAGSTSTTDTTNIAIKTDNATGYTLSIAADTNAISNGNNTVPNANNTNVSLINTDPNCTTAAICTIASIATNTTYTNVSSFNTNTWGYMLSKYNTSTTNWDNLYNYYQAAPTTTASDVDTTSAPNADTFNNYNLSIATKVDDSMTPGTYENTFIIAAITNPLVYNVTYTNASGISASNMPTNISGGMTAAGEGSFTIPSTTPTRTGYTFNKWCTVTPTTTNGVDACTGGDEYASSATYNLTGTTSPQSVTLYAMWTANTYNLVITGDSNVATMSVKQGSTTGTQTSCTQSSTTFTCSNLKYGVNYYLYPTFNTGYEFSSWTKTDSVSDSYLSSMATENAYYTMGAGNGALLLVSKSSCTTMQSLTSSSVATLLPSTGSTATVCDSRDGQEYKIGKLADGKYWMTENLNLAGGTALSADDTDVTSAYISSFSTRNNLTKSGSTIVLPASSTSGFDTANYSYVYNSGNKSSNCASPGCYSYYSWDAATLGSGRYISTDNTDAAQSICPKGWKLPSTHNGTNSTTDFRALLIALGGSASVQTYNSSTSPTGATMSSALQAQPYSFLLAGKYYYGSFSNGGSYGLYWSSTSYSYTTIARYLLFDSSSVSSVGGDSRANGCSVRCLLDS